jgi:uncharacterized damage-inducible protein DinB
MPLFLQRPAANEYLAYYERYISRVPEGNLIEILARNADTLIGLLRQQPPEMADYAYAEGKWTVKEVVGHLCDTERIFAYRLLRFGRGDETPLAGFDENTYVPAGRFSERTLESLLEEFAAVRQASIALIAGLPDEAWSRSGIANDAAMSVRAAAYVIAGHQLHHHAILLERYFSAAVTSS